MTTLNAVAVGRVDVATPPKPATSAVEAWLLALMIRTPCSLLSSRRACYAICRPK
jgi:hypothetical protein